MRGQKADTDPSAAVDASSVAYPGRFPNPTPVSRAGGVPTNGEMTISAVEEPVAGYDRLKTRDVVGSLSSRSRRELAAIESYERAHRNRRAVFSKLRRLRQDKPLRDPDALSTEEVVAALRRFQARGVTLVSRDAKP